MHKDNIRIRLGWADWILTGLFAVIIIVMIAQVFFRYVLNHSLFWSEEIVRYLFVWLVFMGGALVLRDGEHIGVEFFLSRLPGKVSRIIQKINMGLIIAMSLLFAVVGFVWVWKIRGSYSPALGLPLNWLLYGALPATSLLSVIFGLERILKKHDRENKERGTVL